MQSLRNPKLNYEISPISEIIEEMAAGRMAILVDEPERENEGDLLIAADFVTSEAINFMARHGRGLICLTLTEAKCQALNLPLMVASNKSPYQTNFTVSIEAAHGVTTGISAADRAKTVQAAVNSAATPEDIVQPGHIFPLRAHPGGVLARAGHTEAGCDLAKIAGLTPAAVICEVLNEDGSMARMPDLVNFAKEHGIKIGSIVDLIHYRSQKESLISRVGERHISTVHGDFRLLAFTDLVSHSLHLALVCGNVNDQGSILVRVHEPATPLDFLDNKTNDHSWSLHHALSYISNAGCGVVVLLNCSMGIDAFNKNTSSDRSTTSTILRDYGFGAQILRELGVRKMRLMGHERKMPSMSGYDLEVIEFILPGDDVREEVGG